MDLAVEYSLRKSRRAKRIILRVNREGEVTVTVPWYVTYGRGEAFLRQRLAWVKKVQARQRKHLGRRSPLPEPMQSAFVQEYKARAQGYFQTVVDGLVATIGVGAPQIKISDFRSQWGSCNRRSNTIKFSWRLLLAPEPVARYVAAHEVAHLVQANHSKKFWQVVEQLDENFREARRWLKRHGAQLRL